MCKVYVDKVVNWDQNISCCVSPIVLKVTSSATLFSTLLSPFFKNDPDLLPILSVRFWKCLLGNTKLVTSAKFCTKLEQILELSLSLGFLFSTLYFGKWYPELRRRYWLGSAFPFRKYGPLSLMYSILLCLPLNVLFLKFIDSFPLPVQTSWFASESKCFKLDRFSGKNKLPGLEVCVTC